MDNTQQKLVEQSLRDERSRCRAVLDLSSDPMALLDAELRCESANQALADWLGYPKAALEGETLLNLFADGGARFRRSARAKSPSPFEAALHDSRGEALPGRVRITAGRHADGSLAWVVAAIQPL